MLRFVILASESAVPEHVALTREIEKRLMDLETGWQTVMQSSGMLVLCAGSDPNNTHRLGGGSGLLLGTLFSRNPDPETLEAPCRAIFNADETDQIVASAGRHLMSHYWGRYVAVLQNPRARRRWIIRDPSGELPCFVTTFRGITIFFSCLAELAQIGLCFAINWRYVTNRLIHGTGVAGQTGLSAVSEVYQGQCVEITHAGISSSFYWSPFSIAGNDVIEDPVRAGLALHATLKSVTHAWASCHASILHMLSGGLDSSTILACLADAPSRTRITCLTYRRREPTEDLAYARLASRRAGCELIEEFLEDYAPDFEDFLDVRPDPYPLSGGIAWLWMSPCESHLATALQATAVTEGNPGDNMLGANDHRYGVLDYAQRHGLRCGLVSQAAQLAPWINTSFWALLLRAVKGARPAYNTDPISARWRSLRTLLSPEALEISRQPPPAPHPWYLDRQPATRASVMMADAFSYPRRYYDPFCPPDRSHPEPLEPLKSQPLMELCLRLPVYVLNVNGRSRGLIRRAFQQELPREIVNRYWKDHGGAAQVTVLLQNLDFARDLLLNGELLKHGLLSRSSLERTLSSTVTRGVGDVVEVCEAIVLESWMRTIPRTKAHGAL
jgi:asparagine synthase (glutamine-hydrolysing)